MCCRAKFAWRSVIFDIRVAEDFRELLEIAAVHRVPGRKRFLPAAERFFTR
jgi:hypothetical protein